MEPDGCQVRLSLMLKAMIVGYTAGLAACKLYDLACHLWQALSLRPHLEQRQNG